MEYTANIFGYSEHRRFIPGNSVKVNASSLDESLPLIEAEARKQFPLPKFPVVHIDRIFQGDKLVYRTAWSEEGTILAALSLK
jgi:hypothetical protein